MARASCSPISSPIFPRALPAAVGSLSPRGFVPRKLLFESVKIRPFAVRVSSQHGFSVSRDLLDALHAIPHSLSSLCYIFASSSFCSFSYQS